MFTPYIPCDKFFTGMSGFFFAFHIFMFYTTRSLNVLLWSPFVCMDRSVPRGNPTGRGVEDEPTDDRDH